MSAEQGVSKYGMKMGATVCEARKISEKCVLNMYLGQKFEILGK